MSCGADSALQRFNGPFGSSTSNQKSPTHAFASRRPAARGRPLLSTASNSSSDEYDSDASLRSPPPRRYSSRFRSLSPPTPGALSGHQRRPTRVRNDAHDCLTVDDEPDQVAHTGTPRRKFFVRRSVRIAVADPHPLGANSSPTTRPRPRPAQRQPRASSTRRSASVTGVSYGFVWTRRSRALNRDIVEESASSASRCARRRSSSNDAGGDMMQSVYGGDDAPFFGAKRSEPRYAHCPQSRLRHHYSSRLGCVFGLEGQRYNASSTPSRSAGAYPPGPCAVVLPACSARRARHGARATLARHLQLARTRADHGRPRPAPLTTKPLQLQALARRSDTLDGTPSKGQRPRDVGDQVILPVSIIWSPTSRSSSPPAGTPGPLRCFGSLARPRR